MYSKLTLNIKKSVIEGAKRNARLRKKSLSRLVEGYLEKLGASESASLVDHIIKNAPRKKTVAEKEKEILKKKLKQKHGA